jgi:uncharacterized protein DUF6916
MPARDEDSVRDLQELTAADFVPLHGESFRVRSEDAPPFEVELIDVSEGARGSGTRAQFSLVFRGGPNPPLPQRIYRVEHDQLGALDIFLVPLGPDAVGQRYEAVFT